MRAVLVEARFQGPIVTTFAVFGALLAAIGVSGIVSFLVSQETREFGIRVALGARRSDVGLTVIRESLMPALVGVAAGSLGAWALVQSGAVVGVRLGDQRVRSGCPLHCGVLTAAVVRAGSG